MKAMHTRQHGATLIISLIILVLMTLLAVTSFNLGKGSLQTVGNMQIRNTALTAAQETLEQIVSNTNFTNPLIAIIPASGVCPVNSKCIDSNGDGKTDVTVTILAPICVQAAVIPNSQIDTQGPNKDCANSITADGSSFCSNTLWEVSVSAVDATTQAQYSITQGVAVPVNTNFVPPGC